MRLKYLSFLPEEGEVVHSPSVPLTGGSSAPVESPQQRIGPVRLRYRKIENLGHVDLESGHVAERAIDTTGATYDFSALEGPVSKALQDWGGSRVGDHGPERTDNVLRSLR